MGAQGGAERRGERPFGRLRAGLVPAVADPTLQPGVWYQLDLVVEVGKVTLYADGHEVISWQRAGGDPPITGGRVGVMVRGGVAKFQELEQWDVEPGHNNELGRQRIEA